MTAKQGRQHIGAEIQAGLAMAGPALAGFIVVPSLLFQLGMDFAGAYTAYAVMAIAASLVMGWLRQPLLLLPSIAVSMYLVYLVGISQGLSWRQLLGACFAAAVAGLLLCLSPLRRRFAAAVPQEVRRLLPAGLGVMLILSGLTQGRIIVRSAWSVTMLGNFQDPLAYLSLTGIMVTLVMLALKLRGALFWGMAITAAVALAEGFWALPAAPFMLPSGWEQTAGQLMLLAESEAAWGHMLAAGVTLLIVLASVNWLVIASLVPVAGKSHRLLPLTFAFSAVGALAGCLPLSVSPLSAAGALTRTGRLASWCAAMLFLAALFCEPLLASMADFPALVVPVLVGAGMLLLQQTVQNLRQQPLAWDFAALGAAVCLVLLMPLANNITAGLGAALISWCVLRACACGWRMVPLASWGLAVVFAMYFVYAAI